MIPPLAFTKMHGLGNDFVVVDARGRDLMLAPETVRALADRRTGVGFDELIVLRAPRSAGADAFMQILNPDGSEVGACGNAARCVVRRLAEELGRDRVVVETLAGLLESERRDDGMVTVDMGPAGTGWRDVPLARETDTLHLPLALGPLADPVATGMGNPHATFFVADVAAIDIERFGPILEHDPLFPERANIGVAELRGPAAMRLRVWERGVGLTRACGSGACAAVVAAVRRGLAERRVAVEVDGGRMLIEWREDGHVLMTGPAAVSFTGEIAPARLAGPAA
jgi:diaminopimelate epimerase